MADATQAAGMGRRAGSPEPSATTRLLVTGCPFRMLTWATLPTACDCWSSVPGATAVTGMLVRTRSPAPTTWRWEMSWAATTTATWTVAAAARAAPGNGQEPGDAAAVLLVLPTQAAGQHPLLDPDPHQQQRQVGRQHDRARPREGRQEHRPTSDHLSEVQWVPTHRVGTAR